MYMQAKELACCGWILLEKTLAAATLHITVGHN